MEDPMYKRFKFARWYNGHDLYDVRRVLYDKAWEIILESLWTSDEELIENNNDRRLHMISDALSVIDQMTKY